MGVPYMGVGWPAMIHFTGLLAIAIVWSTECTSWASDKRNCWLWPGKCLISNLEPGFGVRCQELTSQCFTDCLKGSTEGTKVVLATRCWTAVDQEILLTMACTISLPSYRGVLLYDFFVQRYKLLASTLKILKGWFGHSEGQRCSWLRD